MNDERYVKDFLQPLGENEGDHVTEMHAVGGGSTASVEVERLFLLESVEDEVELAVR